MKKLCLLFASLFLAANAYGATLVEWGFYDGEDGDTTYTDLSGNAYNPTFVGDAELSNDEILQTSDQASLYLDNSGDYIYRSETNDDIEDITTTTTGDATIEAWVNYDSLSDREFIFNYYDTSNQIALDRASSTNPTRFYIWNGSTTVMQCLSTQTLSTGVWYHIAVVKKGGASSAEWAIYINGQQTAYTSSSATESFGSGTGKLTVGYGVSTDALGGNISRFKISDSNIYSATPNSGKTDTITGWEMPDTSEGVAHFKLNDNAASTTVDDSSVLDNDGTCSVNTSTLSTTGLVNEAFDFDGSAWVDCGDHDEQNVSTGWTMMAWYKKSSHSASNQYIFARGSANTTNDEFGIGVHDTGKAFAYRIVNNSPNRYDWATGTTDLDDGEWHHIVGRYNTTDGVQVFVDKVLEASDDDYASEVHVAPFPNLTIGGLDYASNRYETEGDIDDLRFFTYSVTPGQIVGAYNDGVGTEDDLPNIVSAYARDFVPSGPDYFSIADAAWNSPSAGNSFSVGAWVNLDNYSSTRPIMSKDWGGAGTRSWFLACHSSNYYRFSLSADGTNMTHKNVGTLETGAWHLVVGVFDNDNNLQGVSVDGANLDTSAFTSDVYDTSSALEVGRYSRDAGSTSFDGRMNGVFYYSKALTNTEIATLYADGYGTLCKDFDTDSLEMCLDLIETSGDAWDGSGNERNLTENNTVSVGDGHLLYEASTSRDFIQSVTQYFEYTDDEADNEFDVTSLYVAVWCNFDYIHTGTGTSPKWNTIISKAEVGDLVFFFQQYNSGLYFGFYDDAVTSAYKHATYSDLEAGKWFFVEGFFDTSEVGHALNRSSDNTASHSKTCHIGSVETRIGAYRYSGAYYFYMDGMMDNMAVFSEKPSDTIRDAIYNRGFGLSYDDYVNSGYSTATLIAWYEMDEASGNLVDAHGTTSFVETNGDIESAVGIVHIDYVEESEPPSGSRRVFIS